MVIKPQSRLSTRLSSKAFKVLAEGFYVFGDGTGKDAASQNQNIRSRFGGAAAIFPVKAAVNGYRGRKAVIVPERGGLFDFAENLGKKVWPPIPGSTASMLIISASSIKYSIRSKPVAGIKLRQTEMPRAFSFAI
jgi:hypothetical protein